MLKRSAIQQQAAAYEKAEDTLEGRSVGSPESRDRRCGR
jgi:hypothetical protein